MARLLAELHIDLVRFLRKWLRQWRQAEEHAAEVAQETLVRVARGLHSFNGTTNGQLVTWVRSIATNLATDRARRTRDEWEVLVFDEELDELTVEEPELSEWNEDDTGGSQGRRVVLRLLHEALAGVDQTGQALFWHRLVQGDDWVQTGAAVDLAHTAAKRRYQRIQDRLRATVLAQVAELPPGEAAAVRRWLARIGVSTYAGPP
ncbi:MAG TPA: sigma-70 family RNA polymerase sigma factor [Longimicrobium sp.]